MSRSGYSDDCDNVQLWRQAVARAINGRRGQAFLRDLAVALDALPNKRLIRNDLIRDGEVCALGALGALRGINMTELDPDDYDTVAARFNIANSMAQEIVYENDEMGRYSETPEELWARMRLWVSANLRTEDVDATI